MGGKRVLDAHKAEVIRRIAAGERDKDIQQRFDVSVSGVQTFKRRHRAQIEAERERIDEDMRHMWIADKTARLKVVQDDLEATDGKLLRPVFDKDGNEIGQVLDPKVMTARVTALRYAAEELGQLQGRAPVQVTADTVTVELVGVNIDSI